MTESAEAPALPPGWVWARLGEVCEPPRARVSTTALDGVPFIGLEHIAPHTLRPWGFGRADDMRSAASPFKSGDVLYARMRPYLNKVWRADRDGLASAEFLVFRSVPHLDSDFLALLLHSSEFVAFAHQASSGDRPRVQWTDLAQFAFALPPRAEQSRIVEAVNALFDEVESAEAALTRARASLAQFRASLLHAACTGALTADWRAASRGNGTADDLLTSIGAALAAMEGVPRRRILPPDLTDLPALPAGWRWASVDQLTQFRGNGLSRAPDGEDGDREILRISAVRPMAVNRAARRFYRPLPGEALHGATTQRDDLLFTRYSGSEHFVGVCGRVAFDEPTLYPDKVMCARPPAGLPGLAAFLELALNAGPSRAFIARNIRTTAGQKGIAGSIIRACPVPVPPLAEMAAIIERWEDARPDDAALPAEDVAASLRQSILHAAFTGRLAPQDAAEEPASALLARLRAAAPPRRRAATIEKNPA